MALHWPGNGESQSIFARNAFHSPFSGPGRYHDICKEVFPMNATIAWITKPVLVALFFAGLLFTATAMAGEDQSHDFDADGDGKITFEEVMQKLEKSARKAFDAMDHNKDGVLSDEDFDDVRGGIRKFENWLYDHIKPLMDDDKPGST